LELTLELDPDYPDAQDMLEALKSMAAEKESSTEPAESSGTWHYLICSGNPSLMDAFAQLFGAAEAAGAVRFGRFYASNDDLDASRRRAAEAGLAFAGTRYMGTNSEPAEDLGGILSSLSAQGIRGVHVSTAAVDGAHRAVVEEIYNELLGEATQQGIMPFPMYVTQSEEAARFLTDSLTPVG